MDVWLADPERVASGRTPSPERWTSQLLARWALAQRFRERLDDVQISRDGDGRPMLSSPARGDVSFSLSHTRELVVCGVADADAGIGVDAEQRRPRASAGAIARRFFCAEEARALDRVPPPRRADRFWALWTLKEALVKAARLDLFDGLSACAFRVRGRGRVSHAFCASRAAPPGAWRFALLSPGRAHFVAVALRAERTRRLQIRLHDVTERLIDLHPHEEVRDG